VSGATALVAIDWGTTSARAYRLDAAGEVRDAREAPLGIQQVRDGFAQALTALLGDWALDPAPRLACGMIGSRQGWIEAPYVDCPATPDALTRGIVRVADGALAIVPGLACRDRDGVPDVMRGEETQILGAVAGDSPALVVLPGTHSKWAIASRGTIETFSTYMTGEVYAVLRDHSILGRMAEGVTGAFAADAFARGVRAGLVENGSAGALLHRLFGARTLALRSDLAPQETGDYLSGLLIGSEVAAGRDWARGRGLAAASILLVGSRALCERYSAADAAARGLWRIAKAAAIVP